MDFYVQKLTLILSKLFVVGLVFALPFAHATPPAGGTTITSSTPATGELIFDETTSPKLVFSDGREAVIEIKFTKDVWSHEIGFDIENKNCRKPVEKGTCFTQMELVAFMFNLKWTQHPDASRVGQIVKRKNGNYWESFVETLEPKDKGFLKALGLDDRYPIRDFDFSCQPQNYFHEVFPTTESGTIVIPFWGAETMAENPQTRVNENVFSHTGVELEFSFENGVYKPVELRREEKNYGVMILGNRHMMVTSDLDEGSYCDLNSISHSGATNIFSSYPTPNEIRLEPGHLISSAWEEFINLDTRSLGSFMSSIRSNVESENNTSVSQRTVDPDTGYELEFN